MSASIRVRIISITAPVIFLACVIFAPSASAGTTPKVLDSFTVRVSESVLQKGYTSVLNSGNVILGILPDCFPQPFGMQVQVLDSVSGEMKDAIESEERIVGNVVSIRYSGDNDTIQKAFPLRLKINRDGKYNRVWLRRWHTGVKKWIRVSAQVDGNHVWIGSQIARPGIYAAFESTKWEEGSASWFRDNRPMIVAHNGYPLNSRIRIANLDNAKSVVVTVVSRGPYVQGRVADLSYDAFRVIAEPWQGTARVGIYPVDNVFPDGGSSPAPQPSPAPAPTPSPTPSGGIVANMNVDGSIAARAYASLDAESGRFTSANNANQAYPLASLTKLMTALVFWDTKTSFNKVVTYEQSDDAIGAKLYIQYGDKVTVRDLWYCMLVGSANNATNMLAKATGLSRAAFVKKMNEKAKALGLSTMHFEDVTGLSANNVASAADMARLARHAYALEIIRAITIQKAHYFRTAGRNEPHTITSQNKMIGSGWNLEGTKTGYTDEAKYNLVAQVAGKTTGKHILSVVLGSASDWLRYANMDKALMAGFKPYL